jgi:23S rRNA (uracil1939-C5)-methyltransferase
VTDVSTRVSCEHEDRCAGCPLIALPYDAQLGRKRARVLASVTAYPALETTFVEPTRGASPIVGYRTRAKLVAALRPGGGLLLGLYASGGGHVVLDTPGCRVLSPTIAAVVEEVRALGAVPGCVLARPTSVEGTGSSLLRAIDVRDVQDEAGAHQALVTFVCARDDVRTPATIEELRAVARELRANIPAVLGVALNLREGDSPQVLGSELLVLDGAPSAHDRIGEVAHVATFGAFVQAHRAQARRVHDVLVEALEVGPGLRVLDLYGGSGAIGLALASAGARVQMVESFAPAARLALEAARGLQGGGTFEATSGEVSEVLARLMRSRGREPYPGVVVVNPPRRGVAPLVREQVALLRPQAIAYVSCDPETLARDLDHFARLGYAPARLTPFDMIPLTDEVETAVVLRPAPLPLPRVAYADEEIVIVEKPAHEPTTPQGDYGGSLLSRVRRLPGADQAVPVHRLDAGTSGLVIFAKKAALVTAWAEALAAESGRKIFLAAARGRTPSKGAITRDLRDEGRVLPARTRYRWLGGAGGHSVLRVIPEQGRTHQIRRHLAAIGHPILGDERYGHAATNRFFEEKHALDRTFLHCVRIELTHPRIGERLVVETPLPGDLRLALTRCGGPNVLKFLEGKQALGGNEPSTLPPPPAGAAGSGQYPKVTPRSSQSSDRIAALIDVDPTEVAVGDATITRRPPIIDDDDD